VKYYGKLLGYVGEIISKSICLEANFRHFGDSPEFDPDVVIQDVSGISQKQNHQEFHSKMK
jgi:hypothetical protein